MAKRRAEFKIEERVFSQLDEVANRDFEGNRTAALEDMIRHSSAVRSISECDRDKLRVSSRRGPHSDIYDDNERKMIDFFLV